jgi:hypothetical protein
LDQDFLTLEFMPEEEEVDLQLDQVMQHQEEHLHQEELPEQEELEEEEQVQLMQEQELQEQLIQVVEEEMVVLLDLHFLVDQAEPAVRES